MGNIVIYILFVKYDIKDAYFIAGFFPFYEYALEFAKTFVNWEERIKIIKYVPKSD